LQAWYLADFVCYDGIIVEAKALKEIGGVEAAQVLNYLKASHHEIGLIVNFGRTSLEHRRFIHSENWVHSNNPSRPSGLDEAMIEQLATAENPQ